MERSQHSSIRKNTSLARLHSIPSYKGIGSECDALGIAIGTFDGMHVGHQKVIRLLKEELGKISSRSCACMMSFYPHPRMVLSAQGKERNNLYRKFVTPLQTKLEILSELDVAYLLLVQFNKRLSLLSASDFFDSYLLPLRPKVIVVGEDWRFGRNREGDIYFLKAKGDKHGINVISATLATDEQSIKIGSTKLRDLIRDGMVDEYEVHTNRLYRIKGRVYAGDRRGTQLGFPTANIHITNQILPRSGVYKTRTLVDGKAYPSVTNVGSKPTFKNFDDRLELETHILDFSGDIYKKKISIDFIKFLREEIKFTHKDELIKQIASDIQKARDNL